jgi:energy-coupling factor transporter ATP-binding protein EcfA2
VLRELHIQNLAVIQDITVELHPGFNCFTGQTGAGKSLVIGALEILLGLRQASDILRKGAAEGRGAARGVYFRRRGGGGGGGGGGVSHCVAEFAGGNCECDGSAADGRAGADHWAAVV